MVLKKLFFNFSIHISMKVMRNFCPRRTIPFLPDIILSKKNLPKLQWSQPNSCLRRSSHYEKSERSLCVQKLGYFRNCAGNSKNWIHLKESLLENEFRSSPPRMFLGKGVLKICSKFTGKHTYLVKQLYWNHFSAWVFSCKFAAYFLITFF